MNRTSSVSGIASVAIGLSTAAWGAPAPGTSAWTPSAQEEALLQQLSLRDGSPACAEMEVGLSDPRASWKAVVDHVSMPPWAPMRAADCLISGHSAASRADLVGWVTRPELKGLGLLALGRLDVMPQDVATEVASAAITRGPDPAGARVRVARSANPAIAELAAVKE
ncbi:MAG: hypothetical protein H0V89_03545 [Deltaproteobacteria bacterium]|nr:hypothetical protein [Deltaproteobacteria bacterium]